ncbi:hypothetical protein [Streptomyces sp. NPDC056165]|uniref:hypothetical protein n=1 Tax=Streptomyces sp. NPDC056165 TaxID=3345733 RepID=UPI0035E0F7D3
MHAPNCEKAPQGAPLLDVEHALNVAENPATRSCNLCGCAAELTPLLRGFDHIGDGDSSSSGPRRGGPGAAAPARGRSRRAGVASAPRSPAASAPPIPPAPLPHLHQGHGRKRPQRGCQGSDHARTVGVTCTDAAAPPRLTQEKSQEMPQEQTQELAQEMLPRGGPEPGSNSRTFGSWQPRTTSSRT